MTIAIIFKPNLQSEGETLSEVPFNGEEAYFLGYSITDNPFLDEEDALNWHTEFRAAEQDDGFFACFLGMDDG